MSAWRQFLSWLVVSTLLFGGHFRAYLDPKVRHLKFVQGSDVIPLGLAVLILGFLCFLFAHLLTRAGQEGKRWAGLLFMVALIQGLLVAIRPPPTAASALAPMVTGLTWCLVTVVLWIHYRRPDFAIADRLSRISLLLTPLPLILVFQFLTTPTVPPQSKRALWNQVPAQTGSPIVIAIFDEWSVKRTFPNGALPDWLPRLKELAGTAAVYSNARSAGPETIVAMPRLLLQTTNFTKAQFNHRLELPTAPTLFDRTPEVYQRALVGFHLPYLSLLGGQVDSCQAYPASPRGENLAQKIAYHFLDCLIYWQDPWVEALRRRWYIPGPDKPAHLFGPYWHQLGRTIEDSAVRVLETMPPNTITLFHFPFPHPPMVFASDGGYRHVGFNESNDPEIYRLNLLQVDRTVGRLVDTLKYRRIWDRTLLVVSSDHNWREDLIVGGQKIPEFDNEVQHVPLIVKFPHQCESRIVTDRFELSELATLFSLIDSEDTGRRTESAPAAFARKFDEMRSSALAAGENDAMSVDHHRHRATKWSQNYIID